MDTCAPAAEAVKAGDYVQADVLLSEALASGEGTGTMYADRAQVRHELGRSSAVLQDVNKALELGGLGQRRGQVMLCKAVALQEKMKLDEAFRVVSDIVQLARDSPKEVDSATMRIALRKRDELKHLAATYTPPPLSEFEKRSLVSDDHTLRVCLLASTIDRHLKVGSSTYSVQLCVSNEFGLFVGSRFDVPLKISATLVDVRGQLISTCSLEGDGLVTDHGRLSTQVSVQVPQDAPSIGHIRFGANLDVIVPVLSLPVGLGNAIQPEKDIQTQYGVEFTCCRELEPSKGMRIHVLEAVGELGIAGKLWDGGKVLLEVLVQRKGLDVTGKSVLELGAGTGAVGVGLKLLGASQVTITDLGEVLGQIQANVDLNQVEADVKECAWGETKLDRAAEIVCFADCIYDPEMYQPLIETLDWLTQLNPKLDLIWAHRHRNPQDHEFFQKMNAMFSNSILHGPGPKFAREANGPSEKELCELSASFNVSHGERTDVSSQKSSGPHGSHDVSVYLSKRRT